jgi:hypothetical protein
VSASWRDFRFQHSAQWDRGANPAEWVPAHPTPEHQRGRKQREFRLAAQISSDDFFFSELFLNLPSKTQDFYNGLLPMINRTFTTSETSFKNAFIIFDLLNVASTHNSTDDFPAAYLLTPEILFQLRTLADTHEFNLAYNKSEPIRAVTGPTVAA